MHLEVEQFYPLDNDVTHADAQELAKGGTTRGGDGHVARDGGLEEGADAKEEEDDADGEDTVDTD